MWSIYVLVNKSMLLVINVGHDGISIQAVQPQTETMIVLVIFKFDLCVLQQYEWYSLSIINVTRAKITLLTKHNDFQQNNKYLPTVV
jgi:hypothetical protein